MSGKPDACPEYLSFVTRIPLRPEIVRTLRTRSCPHPPPHPLPLSAVRGEVGWVGIRVRGGSTSGRVRGPRMDKYAPGDLEWVRVMAELQPLLLLTEVLLGNSALHALCSEPQDWKGNVPTSCFSGHMGCPCQLCPWGGDDSVAVSQEI